EIRTQGWKVDAETRRTDLNFVELQRPGVFQTFYISGREAHDQLGTEMNHDPPGLVVVTRGKRPWDARLQVLRTLVCLFEIVTRCHELAPVPGTIRRGGSSSRQGCA